jgi:MYXO-CTERM domain-containing protein
MNRIAFTLGLALALPNTASACGGFFCNPDEPVDQAGEDILFAVDPANETVTVHVQIQYQGPAEEFAWVVPVPAAPEIDLSTDALFDALRSRGATFNMNYTTDGVCAYDGWSGSSTGSSTSSASSGAWDYSSGAYAPAGVTIVSTGRVGPYETVVLAATDSVALTQWLIDNGYDLPPGIEPLLASYVSTESNFVALKLAKSADDGDLAPLSMTYPGTVATIPIQLTSIAATPDMRLRVYVLGDERAVPENYLHVQMNPAAVDWWSWWDNRWEEAVSLAADEAGGQAFATDFSGDPSSLVGTIFATSWDNIDFAGAADAYDFMNLVVGSGLPADDLLLSVLEAHYDMGESVVTVTDLANCPSCYSSQMQNMEFDVLAAADSIEVFILEPRRAADALFADYPVLTRMTSSVSPEEMTIDPVFVFNPDMPAVNSIREATETLLCAPGINSADAARELYLPDGRRVMLPPRSHMNLSDFEYLDQVAQLTLPAAAVIEKTSASGEPEILVDNRPSLTGDANDHNLIFPYDELSGQSASGCGCATGGGAPVGVFGLMLGALALRRRD